MLPYHLQLLIFLLYVLSSPLAFALDIHILEDDACLNAEQIRAALLPIYKAQRKDTNKVDIVFKRIAQSDVRSRYKLFMDAQGIESVRTFAINHSECSEAPELIAFYIEDDLHPIPHHGTGNTQRDHPQIGWNPYVLAIAGYAPATPKTGRWSYGGGIGIETEGRSFVFGTSLRFRQAQPYLLELGTVDDAQVLLNDAQLLLSPGLYTKKLTTSMHLGIGRTFWRPSGLSKNISGSATAVYFGATTVIDLGHSWGLVFEWLANLRRPRFQLDNENSLLTSHFSSFQFGLKYSFR